VAGKKRVKIVCTCTINRPAKQLFEFWRHFENLPKVIKHLISVTETSDKESHWVASTAGDKRLEWDSVVINEHPGEMIAWRTKEGSGFEHAGSVRFESEPGNSSTQVTLSFEYIPPAGQLGSARQTGSSEDPAAQVQAELMRFKELMETGQLPSEAQPVGAQRKKATKAR